MPHSWGGGSVSLESPFHLTDSGCFENGTNRASDHALVQEEIVEKQIIDVCPVHSRRLLRYMCLCSVMPDSL